MDGHTHVHHRHHDHPLHPLDLHHLLHRPACVGGVPRDVRAGAGPLYPGLETCLRRLQEQSHQVSEGGRDGRLPGLELPNLKIKFLFFSIIEGPSYLL